MTKECRNLNGSLANPSLVGPDFGGHCPLYKCHGDEVEFIPKPEAPLPAPESPNKIVCPGVKGVNIPSDVVKAIKCFNGIDHPSDSSGTPSPNANSTAVASPAAQTRSRQAALHLLSVLNLPLLSAKTTLSPTPANVFPEPATPEPYISASMTRIRSPRQGWSFVGPDYGGRCSFYSTLGCDEGSEVALGEGAAEKSITCPGKVLTPKPALDKAVAIKCFSSTAPADPAGAERNTTTTTTTNVTPSPVNSPVKRLIPEHPAKFPSSRRA
ncbi:hypothetical protein PMIN03_000742 [Paraphaeosphaeria minitans]